MIKKNLFVENHDGVAQLTINRPKALNALNTDLLDELQVTFEELDLNENVKAVIITGSGEKAFVAGADIAEMTDMDSMKALAFARRGQRLVGFIGRMTKPIIAAVNGFALGGGLELALACDFIYTSEKAKFGFPEVTLGIMPGFGGTQKLARIIGRNRANEMIFTGKVIRAEQAEKWGIVNTILPAGDLIDGAIKTAQIVASNSLLGVAHAKDAIKNGLEMSEEDGMRYESALFATLYSSNDQQEGMRAFLEKRKARFTGS
ncbi:MAG: enoyl-CoA hydratase/isomerase family protein [Proteobacteria bacterium]|nr:enoyl-CoA hydratase/isomerase family protein [Pseudomonadota bacterium]